MKGEEHEKNFYYFADALIFDVGNRIFPNGRGP